MASKQYNLAYEALRYEEPINSFERKKKMNIMRAMEQERNVPFLQNKVQSPAFRLSTRLCMDRCDRVLFLVVLVYYTKYTSPWL